MDLNKIKDLLPLPSYSVILLTFLFPFVLFTCNDQTLMSVKGYELVMGFDPEEKMGDDLFGDMGNSWLEDDYDDETYADDDETSKSSSPNPLIIIALLAALTGFILVFVKGLKKRVHINIAIGLIGFLSLLLFSVFIQSETEDYTSEMMSIGIKFGNAFYLACALFLVIVCFFAYYLYEEQQAKKIENQIPSFDNDNLIGITTDDVDAEVAAPSLRKEDDMDRYKPS